MDFSKLSLSLLIGASVSYAATLGAASPFNVVSFGSISSLSDIGGRVAVQGSVNSDLDIGVNDEIGLFFNSAGAAYQSQYTTILGSGNNGKAIKQMANGDMYVPGFNSGSVIIQNGTGNIVTSGPSPINWNALYSSMTSLSTFLKSASAHSGAYTPFTTNFVVDTTGLTDNVMANVQLFRLSLTELQNLREVKTQGKTVLIDIDLSSLAPNGTVNTSSNNFSVNGQQPFAGNSAAARVLFNLCPGLSASACATANLNLNVGWYGALLAPTMTVQGNHQYNGQMIVGNLNFNGEIHGMPFLGSVPFTDIPEPSAMILCASGVAILAAARRAVRS